VALETATAECLSLENALMDIMESEMGDDAPCTPGDKTGASRSDVEGDDDGDSAHNIEGDDDAAIDAAIDEKDNIGDSSDVVGMGKDVVEAADNHSDASASAITHDDSLACNVDPDTTNHKAASDPATHHEAATSAPSVPATSHETAASDPATPHEKENASDPATPHEKATSESTGDAGVESQLAVCELSSGSEVVAFDSGAVDSVEPDAELEALDATMHAGFAAFTSNRLRALTRLDDEPHQEL
jgi:hypothetical protein